MFRRKKWDVDWADMTSVQDGDFLRWVLNQDGKDLLNDGWEPFSVTCLSVYWPGLPGAEEMAVDKYVERVWFRKKV
jgi:hypothetical protein